MTDRPKAEPTTGIGPDTAFVSPSGNAETSAAEVPKSVDRYRLGERLGSGGLGDVFAAHDPRLDRTVAIKLLRLTQKPTAKATKRLRREAEALARLSHPNVVTVYDVGTYVAGDSFGGFIAMERVAGLSLDRWLVDQARSVPEILEVFRAAGRGLVAAHALGIVHRDFKPGNVMVGDDGRVRVLDFGLAAFDDAPSTSGEFTILNVPGSGSGSQRLTETGMVMGTVAYMAPEQHFGRSVDARADQFAFSVALFEALYGHRPYAGRGRREIAAAIGQQRIEAHGREGGVPPAVERAVLRGIRADPRQRFASMDELLSQLRPQRFRAGRWLLPAAGASAALAAVAWPQPEVPCEPPVERLAGVWDDATRARLRQGFVETTVVFAAESWERVGERLDAHTEEWLAHNVASCRRQRAGVEASDATRHCLDARLSELRALIDALAEPDAQTVQHAVRATAALTPPGRCEDPSFLALQAPAAADPEVAQTVGNIEAQLDVVDARYRVGQVDEALRMSQQLVEQAAATGHPPIVARALGSRGNMEMVAGKFEDSAASLREAYFVADGAGLDRKALDMTILLAAVLGNELARHDEAEQWVRHGEAAVRRIGEGTVAHAKLLSAQARLASANKDHAAAKVGYERGLQIFEDQLGMDSIDVAVNRFNIALQLRYLGRYAESEEMYRSVLGLYEDNYGRTHPLVASVLHNMSTVIMYQGRLDEAQKQFERALEIRLSALGDEHPDVAETYTNLANTHYRKGEREQAYDYTLEAYSIDKLTRGERHPVVIGTLNNLGTIADGLGRPEVAQQWHRKALDLAEATFDPDSPQLARVIHNYAGHLGGRGDAEASREHYERALAIRIARFGKDDHRVATTESALGVMLAHAGRPVDAMPHLRRAVELRAAGEGDPVTLADSRFELAKALSATGQRVAGRGQAQRALEGLVDEPDKTRDVKAWLANNDE